MVTDDNISVTDLLTDRELIACSLGVVAGVSHQHSRDGGGDGGGGEGAPPAVPPYFGCVTHQQFGAIAVGFVCHIFKCDTDATVRESKTPQLPFFLVRFAVGGWYLSQTD